MYVPYSVYHCAGLYEITMLRLLGYTRKKNESTLSGLKFFIFNTCQYLIFIFSLLGEMVLGDPVLSQAVTLTCLKALHWPDGPSGIRAAGLLEIVIPK
jgi:hypothetical protein